MSLRCGNCRRCPARLEGVCSGCPGCARLFRACRPGPDCRRCGMVCPDWHGDGVWAHVRWNLGGLSFPRGVRIRSPELPPHVPMVSGPLRLAAPEGLLPWVALHAGKAGLRTWEAGSVRERYRLAPGTRLILSFFVRDSTLRRFWRERPRWVAALAREGAAAFAPNFSVWEDAPRVEHLVSMKMSALCAAELAAAGVPVVLDASWREKEDLDRWAEFAAEAGAGAVAFSFQNLGAELKGLDAWKEDLAGFRYLCGILPGGVRAVAVGAASPPKVREILAAAGGRPVSFLDPSSFVTARRGGMLLREGRPGKESGRGMALDEAFFENVRRFRRMLNPP